MLHRLKKLYNSATNRLNLEKKHSVVETKNVPHNISDIVGKYVYLGKEVQIYKESCSIGDYTYINGGKIFYAKIGKFCSLAYGIYIGSGEHPLLKVTTYPIRAKVNGESGLVDFPEQNDTIIGNDVWIGNNVSIKQGVTIGDGSVIATGSVVTKNVPPYCIVGGVPARVIRYRFSESDIEKLLQINWWNWPTDKIREAIQNGDFENIHVFIEKYLTK